MKYARGFAVRISGDARCAGEYDGGPTFDAAAKVAAEMRPHVRADASVRIVRFSRDGERAYAFGEVSADGRVTRWQ